MKKKCTNPECEQPLKNFDEFRKDNQRKDGLSYRCKICEKEYYQNNKDRIKQYQKNNKDRIAKQSQERYESNKEKLNKQSRSYYSNNKKAIAQHKREHSKSNPGKLAERTKKWRDANPDKQIAHNAKRRAARIHRSVPWANLKKIQELYWVAKTLTARTGIKWVVDHKIPLQGKNVSGLHVENNLQVITALANSEKFNKFTPALF